MQQVIDEIVLSYLNKEFPYFNDELKNLIASVSSIKYISKGETLIQAGQYLNDDGSMKIS